MVRKECNPLKWGINHKQAKHTSQEPKNHVNQDIKNGITQKKYNSFLRTNLKKKTRRGELIVMYIMPYTLFWMISQEKCTYNLTEAKEVGHELSEDYRIKISYVQAKNHKR